MQTQGPSESLKSVCFTWCFCASSFRNSATSEHDLADCIGSEREFTVPLLRQIVVAPRLYALYALIVQDYARLLQLQRFLWADSLQNKQHHMPARVQLCRL